MPLSQGTSLEQKSVVAESSNGTNSQLHGASSSDLAEGQPVVANPKTRGETLTRHFKALTKKNAISWARTPLGSIFELILPILLMLSIVWVRTMIQPKYLDGYDISSMKKSFYPTAKLDSKGAWEMDFNAMSAQSDEQAEFMKYTGVWPGAYFKSRGSGLGANLMKELTVFQEKSPLFFAPPHCIQRDGMPYSSPVIGYVKSDSQIQSDVVSQLSLLFEKQREMMAMLTSIAEEGHGESDEAKTRMNQAITKFIGTDFIVKSILMDQGFDAPTAEQMATALTDPSQEGDAQTNVLKALGLNEDQARQVATLFRIQSDGLDLAVLADSGLLDMKNLDASKRAAISYVLAAPSQEATNEQGFNLANLYNMGIFEHMDMSEKQKKSLKAIVQLSQSDADLIDLDATFFTDLGLTTAQADKLITAFNQRKSGGFSPKLLQESGIIDSLGLSTEQKAALNLILDNYGQKISYESLTSSNVLELFGLSEQEQIAVESMVGLKEKKLSIQDLRETGLLTAIESTGEGQLLEEALALYNGDFSISSWESLTLVKNLDLTPTQLGAVALVMDVAQNGLDFNKQKVEALLVAQDVPAAKAKTAAKLIELQYQKEDYDFEALYKTGVFDELNLDEVQMQMVMAVAELAPKIKKSEDGNIKAQLSSLMQMANMPLVGEDTTLGSQVQQILPILLSAAQDSESDQNSRLSVLNLLLTMQQTMERNQADGKQTDIMSIILPAIAEQYKGSLMSTDGNGRRLEAEHVDFNQLDQIFQSGDFQSVLGDMMAHPVMQEEVIIEEEPVQGRYKSIIVEFDIEIPEDMQDDLVAILNHGGLSPEQAELIALMLIHAPIEENPHLVDHLGMTEKPALLEEVSIGYGKGTMPLKLLGFDTGSEDGRQLQQNSAGQASLQGSTGPSTQMYIMNLMNQILGSLTSDFQTALNKTGYFSLAQATKVKDIIVEVWSENGKYLVQNNSVWVQEMGLTPDIVACVRAMANNRPTAEYPLAAMSQIDPTNPDMQPLIIDTVMNVSQYMIGSNRYYLMRFGATRAQIDTVYEFIYNQKVPPKVYLAAMVDTVAQGLEYVGTETDYYTPQMGVALGQIFKDSVNNGTDLDVAIAQLKDAGASDATITLLTGLSMYINETLPTFRDYLEFNNVTTQYVIDMHINISNQVAPWLVKNQSAVLRFIGMKPAQTEVLFYYLGYGDGENLPLSAALAETLNMKQEDTAFTGQLIKALSTPQTNFTESTELLGKLGMTPAQFMVVRGLIFAGGEGYLEFTAGMMKNKTVYPDPGWWTYATLGYRNPEVDFLLGQYRPQEEVKEIMGYQRGYNLVGLPFGKALADTGYISQQQGLVLQEMVYAYATGNVKQLAYVLGISETTAKLLYLVSQGQFRELHELLFTNTGQQMVLKIDSNGVPVADMNATIATILFREMGIDAQNARYYGGASAGEINYQFVGLDEDEARLVQKLAAGKLDIPALQKKGKLSSGQSDQVKQLSGFNNDSISEVWLQMQLWNNQGISPDDLNARLAQLNNGGRRLQGETNVNLTPEQIRFIDIVAEVASGQAPLTALTNNTMLKLVGLNRQQTSLVQAAIDVRDSGFQDAKSREQLFDAMELNTTQQAKLGLAIDISKGNLDMDSFEDSKYFKEIDMTPEQVDVFEEILMISKGELDQPLEESKLAKKYNVELSDVQLMQEAQILTNTLDISRLEGTKLAELIGIEEEQLKQLVAVQQGDFQAMKEAGVFKQLGFDKEEVLFEQLYNAALKDDLQNTLLETAGAFYAAGSLYGDKSASSGATVNPLAALANAGLLKGSLNDQQISVITLLLDLATGNKKANQVGIDDIKSILETQGFSEKEIAVIQLLQKMSGGDFEYSTLEEAGIFEELGLTADQLQKLQIAYDLMQKPINFKNVADSGIFKGTDLEDSGAIDLLLKIESDEPGSIDQVKDMATLLGVTEEQMSQIEAIYSIDGQSKSLTTQQLLALQKVVGFDLNEQQITVLQAMEKIPLGQKFSYQALEESGLFEAIEIEQTEKDFIKNLLIEIDGDKPLNFKTLEKIGVLDQFDMTQIGNIEVALKVQESHPELFNTIIAQNGFVGQAELEAAIMKELSSDEYTYLFYDMRLLGKYYSRVLEKQGASDFGSFKLKPFDTKEDLGNYYSHPDHGYMFDGLCFGFAIKEDEDENVELEIMGNDFKPENMQMLPIQAREAASVSQAAPMIKEFGFYAMDGFGHMQNLVANTVIKRKSGKADAGISTVIAPFKHDGVWLDSFNTIMLQTIHFIGVLAFVPLVYRGIYRVVSEKETRAKEVMLMMGLDQRIYWLSWVFWWTLNNLIISSAMVSALYFGGAFTNTEWSIMFVLFFVYGQALFGYMLIAQSLFFNSLQASLVSTLIYFGTATTQFLINPYGTSRMLKLTLQSAFPPVAFAEGLFAFAKFEGSIGANWETWNMPFNNTSMQDAVLCLCFGMVYLCVVGGLMEVYGPKEFGQSFDFFSACKKKHVFKTEDVRRVQTGEWQTRYMNEQNVEQHTSALQQKEMRKRMLMVEDIFKTYSNGHKALNGINLKIYEDQIFALLGQNGAGKTTFFSLLTGLYQPSLGQGECFGIDMFKNMSHLRQFMGVCPQFDVMFELLTVEEHLDFFYELKLASTDKRVKHAEIQKLMKDAGVADKKNALVSHLSGGNRRKVSVCVSLCGNSKFVLLDEPTSGMDLGARRRMWNMLREYRRNRIVLLTTHYMDEADVLGDRIGIMTAGQLTCLGTSMFLKKRFGHGYKIFIQKQHDNQNSSELLKYFHVQLGSDVVVQKDGYSELSFRVPSYYADKLSGFLSQLDQAKDLLGVKSYGISVPTLEDVFFAVKDEAMALEQQSPSNASASEFKFPSKRRNRKAITDNTNQEMVVFDEKINQSEMAKEKSLNNMLPYEDEEEARQVSSKKVVGTSKSFMEDFKGVLYKRKIIYQKEPRRFFQQSILPCILFVVGFYVCQGAYQQESETRVQLPDRLPLPQKLLFNPTPIVGSNSQIAALTEGLTDSDSFKVSYNNEWTKESSMWDFTNAVDTFGHKSYKVDQPITYGSYLVYEANKAAAQYKFVSFVNTTSQDSAGLFPQFMYESILRDALDNENFQFRIKTSSLPRAKIPGYSEDSYSAIGIIYTTAVVYSLMLSNIVSYLVVERVSGLKLLQVISGMQLAPYWAANFIVDWLKMLPVICTTLIVFQAWNLEYEAAWLTYLLFPMAVIPFTYVTSLFFKNDNSAQSYTMFFNFMMISTFSSFVYAFRGTAQLEKTGDDLHLIFKIIPCYNVASSVFFDAMGNTLAKMRVWSGDEGTGAPLDKDIWSVNNVTGDVLASIVHFVVWFTVLAIMEKIAMNPAKMPKGADPRDRANRNEQKIEEDVLAEERRIEAGARDVLQIKGLRKEYTSSFSQGKCSQLLRKETCVAVTDLSLGVQKGETLALLGVNGAGKTTTFKTLSNEVQPSYGQVLIGGYEVAKNFDIVKRMIGYCPQYTKLVGEMSIEQTLWYFATIRGVDRAERAALVEDVITDLGLGIHRHKQIRNLSGGNQRKVSFAIAVMGNPDVILLDEPSAGVDPDARRYLQAQVRRIAAQKTSAIVMTSHSMEEAESVSSKMGIMVKGGQFKCFGSAQHIRSKFMTGFVIEIKITNLEQQELEAHQQRFMREGTLMHEDVAWLSEELKDSLQAVNLNDVQDEQTERDLIQSMHVQISQLQCIQALAQKFSRVEQLERFDNWIKVRVPVEPETQAATTKTNRRVKIMNMGTKKEDQKASASTIFALMEEQKQMIGSMDYSVTQTTLEQIFQAVVRLDESSSQEGVAYECRAGKLFEAK